MNSRMEKYSDEDVSLSSRVDKNNDLYKEIGKSQIDKFNLNSNVSIIGDNKHNIDINALKDILEKKYNDTPRRRTINLDQKEEPIIDVQPEENKEYDINSILEKAREAKEIDYESDRLKKLRNTQYDILKNLDLSSKREEKETTEEEDLINLINTITEKEFRKKEEGNEEPLDLLADLKGSDNTEVLAPITEESIITKEVIKPQKVTPLDHTVEIKDVKKDIPDKSFYTGSINFSKSDFDDQEKGVFSKIIIAILIILLVIGIIIGIIFVLDLIMDYGIFDFIKKG